MSLTSLWILSLGLIVGSDAMKDTWILGFMGFRSGERLHGTLNLNREAWGGTLD